MSEHDRCWGWEMRAYVSADGGMGKTDWHTSFGLGVDRDMFTGECRAMTRKRIVEVFHGLDMQVDVRFEDECPTCGELLPSCGGPEIVCGCPEHWHRGDVE